MTPKQRGYLGIWTRPADRMKTKLEHRVPITLPMYEMLNSFNVRTGSVFKSQNETMLFDMTLSALMNRMHKTDENGFVDTRSGVPTVTHGLRSTFRDWVAETGQACEAAELRLAHRFGTKVEHAYYRTDLLYERAKLMIKWYNFLEGEIDKV